MGFRLRVDSFGKGNYRTGIGKEKFTWKGDESVPRNVPRKGRERENRDESWSVD